MKRAACYCREVQGVRTSMQAAGLHRLASRVCRSLPELLRSCDIVSSVEPLNPLARHLVWSRTQQSHVSSGRSGVSGHPSWQTASAQSRCLAGDTSQGGSAGSAPEEAAAADAASTAAAGGEGQAEGSTKDASEDQHLSAEASDEAGVRQEVGLHCPAAKNRRCMHARLVAALRARCA